MDQLLDELLRAASDMDDAAGALEVFKEGEALGQFLRERAKRIRGAAAGVVGASRIKEAA